jgi:3'(2'), 5'-bisphosphate nucleotidase
MDLSRELAVAIDLARQAGEKVLALAGPGLAVERKDDDSPVTEADKRASAFIVGGLAAAFPGDGILSEEAPDDGTRISHARVWMIDPIDGTNDYIKGRDGFSVMLGLIEGTRPVLGVVFQPRGDRMYYAATGRGAFLSEAGGPAKRLHVSSVADPAGIRMVASRSHRTPVIDKVRAELGISDELNIGSVGLKLGLIAAGVRDLYVNPSSHSKLWDACGPEAILVEAGGRLSDVHGDPLAYRGRLDNARGIIASNGILHGLIVERLATLFPRPE